MEKFELPHQHGEKNIEHIHSELSQHDRFSTVSEMLKQLADTTRLKIFWLLCHEEECVINIAALLDMSSPAVSHHLRSLYDYGLITSRRDGKEVYYKVADKEECELLHKTVEKMMEITCPQKTIDYSMPTEEIIHKIHEYMMEHIADRVTIEELSKQFLMNPTTLKKAFKDAYGTSLAVHMKQHRMEHAAKLLQETSDSISQIAFAVGYESQSRFTSAFKQTFGLLPSVYRKMKK